MSAAQVRKFQKNTTYGCDEIIHRTIRGLYSTRCFLSQFSTAVSLGKGIRCFRLFARTY